MVYVHFPGGAGSLAALLNKIRGPSNKRKSEQVCISNNFD